MSDNQTKHAMSITEIAEHEGCSKQAVEQVLKRAYAKVRKIMETRGLTIDDLRD